MCWFCAEGFDIITNPRYNLIICHKVINFNPELCWYQRFALELWYGLHAAYDNALALCPRHVFQHHPFLLFFHQSNDEDDD